MSFRPAVAAAILTPLCLSAEAHAQALEVAPITVEMPAGRLTTTLRVTNRGAAPTTVQIRPFAWSQAGGDDRLDPTGDLLVGPPFSTIPPGSSQTVRLVLRHGATLREEAYRLILDQLPPEAAPGSVRVALRISLPVFAAPAAGARTVLSWRLVVTDPTHATLVIRNDGTRRAHVSQLTLAAGAAHASFPRATFHYVLAGSAISVPVDLDRDGAIGRAGTAHITATTDQGRVEADVPVAAQS